MSCILQAEILSGLIVLLPIPTRPTLTVGRLLVTLYAIAFIKD